MRGWQIPTYPLPARLENIIIPVSYTHLMNKNSSGFLGGIHPADGSDKELTVQAAVTEVNPDIVEI